MNRVKYNFTISRDYYHEDGNLMYQVIDVVFVLKLLLSFWDLKLTISVYQNKCYVSVKSVICLIIFLHDCRLQIVNILAFVLVRIVL